MSWGVAPINSLAEQSVIDPPYTQPVFVLGAGLTSGRSYTSITASAAQTLSTGSILTIGAGTAHDQTVTVSASTTTTTINVTSFTANASYPKNTPVALPNEGYLGVQVNGVTGTAPASVSAVSVTITSVTSGASTTYTPDSNGCVYQDEVPGKYYVTLGQPHCSVIRRQVREPHSNDTARIAAFASESLCPAAGVPRQRNGLDSYLRSGRHGQLRPIRRSTSRQRHAGLSGQHRHPKYQLDNRGGDGILGHVRNAVPLRVQLQRLVRRLPSRGTRDAGDSLGDDGRNKLCIHNRARKSHRSARDLDRSQQLRSGNRCPSRRPGHRRQLSV